MGRGPENRQALSPAGAKPVLAAKMNMEAYANWQADSLLNY